MLFSWWRNRRRRRVLASPFPDDWRALLTANCRQYAVLEEPEQQRLRERVQLFLAEKQFEGCAGFVITDEVRVTIAAHAQLLALGLPEIPYERLLSVLVYPDTFINPLANTREYGVVVEAGGQPRLGEAWYQGPVILSWREIREQTGQDRVGRNVIVHEFAHLLDMADHSVDGVPLLNPSVDPEQWSETFEDEFERFRRQVRLGRLTVVDAYGASKPAEFFAVACEAFFERSRELQASAPTLYHLLRTSLNQDPASWASLN